MKMKKGCKNWQKIMDFNGKCLKNIFNSVHGYRLSKNIIMIRGENLKI